MSSHELNNTNTILEKRIDRLEKIIEALVVIRFNEINKCSCSSIKSIKEHTFINDECVIDDVVSLAMKEIKMSSNSIHGVAAISLENSKPATNSALNLRKIRCIDCERLFMSINGAIKCFDCEAWATRPTT